MGAQKNFTKFANFIVEEWDKDDIQFNEQFYRNIVVIAIIFKCIDKIVPKQEWYEKGYKANIVVYTLSYLHYLINVQYPAHELNMRLIWDKQKVPDNLYDELVKMTKFVFLHITDDKRPITNVTEWCKKEQCWIALKAKKYEISSSIEDILIDKEEIKKVRLNGRREHIVVNGIQVQAEVVSKGQEYWEAALSWGKSKNLLNEIEMSFLSAATKMNVGRIPSEKQCQRIVNIEAKLLDEGFLGKR